MKPTRNTPSNRICVIGNQTKYFNDFDDLAGPGLCWPGLALTGPGQGAWAGTWLAGLGWLGWAWAGPGLGLGFACAGPGLGLGGPRLGWPGLTWPGLGWLVLAGPGVD